MKINDFSILYHIKKKISFSRKTHCAMNGPGTHSPYFLLMGIKNGKHSFFQKKHNCVELKILFSLKSEKSSVIDFVPKTIALTLCTIMSRSRVYVS